MRILVKAVPGSSRNQVVGRLGDRLKVKVAAAPEDGRANKAICRLIADAVGVSASRVTILAGHGSAEKVIRVEGRRASELLDKWD